MNDAELKTCLDSSDPQMNQTGLDYLEKSGELAQLQLLLNFVKSSANADLKKKGIQVGARLIRGNLIAHYQEIKPKMRKSLTQLLGTLDPRIVDSIAEDLKSENEDTRFHAICILGLMGKNPRTRELLETMVGDRNVKVRATAISLMKALIDRKDMKLITSMLRDDDNRVVANVIEVLESTNIPQMVPVVTKYKNHANNRVRANALKALYRLGNLNIYKPLQEMIENKDDHLMRTSACWVIGELFKESDFEYLGLLESCLQDKEKLVRENAIKAFLKIGGNTYQRLSEIANQSEIQEVRRFLGQE